MNHANGAKLVEQISQELAVGHVAGHKPVHRILQLGSERIEIPGARQRIEVDDLRLLAG